MSVLREFSDLSAEPAVRGFLHEPAQPSGDGLVLTHGAGANCQSKLLIALAEEKEGIVRPVLEKCGVQPEAIIAEAQRLAVSLPKTNGMQPGMYLSQPLNQVIERAFDEATHFKDEFVSTEHLLLSLAQQRGDPAGQLLDRAGHFGATGDDPGARQRGQQVVVEVPRFGRGQPGSHPDARRGDHDVGPERAR